MAQILCCIKIHNINKFPRIQNLLLSILPSPFFNIKGDSKSTNHIQIHITIEQNIGSGVVVRIIFGVKIRTASMPY
jgi:hypothetical protein